MKRTNQPIRRREWVAALALMLIVAAGGAYLCIRVLHARAEEAAYRQSRLEASLQAVSSQTSGTTDAPETDDTGDGSTETEENGTSEDTAAATDDETSEIPPESSTDGTGPEPADTTKTDNAAVGSTDTSETDPGGTGETAKDGSDASDTEAEEEWYILNTSSKKFHRPSCSSAAAIRQENLGIYDGDREDLIAQGYSPCKRCAP